MNIQLTRAQVSALIKAIDGPSVIDQRLAVLYDTLKAALENDRLKAKTPKVTEEKP
jgi:hypothetical protein